MKGLTPKQKRFADEYLVDLNGTRAYKTAYPNIKKEETAAACASKLLRKANIADYIKKQQQELQQKTKITQERVLQELANIAFSWEIRTHDKLKALELIGKHIGMFGQLSKAEEVDKQLQKAVELLGGIDSVIE